MCIEIIHLVRVESDATFQYDPLMITHILKEESENERERERERGRGARENIA